MSANTGPGEVVLDTRSFVGEVTLSQFGADVVVVEQRAPRPDEIFDAAGHVSITRRYSIPMHAIAWIRWDEDVEGVES